MKERKPDDHRNRKLIVPSAAEDAQIAAGMAADPDTMEMSDAQFAEAAAMRSMRYPAKLEPDGDGWVVSFPDIPEALTSGKTKEEALEMAADALATAIGFYFEDRRAVPAPSKVGPGLHPVELPASVSAKVRLSRS